MRSSIRIKAQSEAPAAKPGLWAYVAAARPEIERALDAHLPTAPRHVDGKFNEALRYAIFPGGKRLRPVLTLLGAELVGGAAAAVLPAAAAVEFVHTSSLIFDDLPCMDDARERRGQSPLHLRFGEGLSVLVALALMNASYGLIFEAEAPRRGGERALRAHAELVECIGAGGMVAGQAIDLSVVAAKPQIVRRDKKSAKSAAGDESLRNLKTSALIRFALRLGATLSGASDAQLGALSRYAELLGDAYQTSDDVIDLEEDAAVFGNVRVANFALDAGPEGARRRVAGLTADAKATLAAEFGPHPAVRLLSDLADYVAERKS